ncbi:MAG: hypothetical protein N4A38_04070 [Candidatus Gracilibacteria bacterium]|nr:hypothetical protein [Candidatus Gracilibacteria bacterium]
MDKEQIRQHIITPAWEIVLSKTSLKKFYILPGLLSMIFMTGLLVYQFTYTAVVLFKQDDRALKIILDFFHSDYLMPILITAGIIVLCYFILAPIFEVGLIKKIESIYKEKEMSASDAVGQGVVNFWPLFEYNNIFSEFKLLSIFNLYLFAIRFVGVEYITGISYVFLFLAIISVIINILFSYAKYIIVLEKKPIFEAISKSVQLVFFNLHVTIRLYFLMFVLNTRVIINFIVFLFIPIALIGAFTYITSQLFLFIAVILLSIIGLGVFALIAYLGTVLDILKASIWYYAYLEALDNAKNMHGHED